jgi:hypothetical protein
MAMRGYDRGYDYGLRGWPQARGMREPVRTRFTGARGGYGRDFGARDVGGRGVDDYDRQYRATPLPNRVTARYNLDYVREQHPGERPINPVPYGGDRIGRVGDMREYHGPYRTVGGTSTMRGGWPMDWERHHDRYDWGYPNYRSDYGRWF